MQTTTALTSADFDSMTHDDRWQGFGYLGERRNALTTTDPEAPAIPERVAEIDALLIEHANRHGLDYDDLFTWANSKNGRHFADMVFGGDTIDQEVAWRLAPRGTR